MEAANSLSTHSAIRFPAPRTEAAPPKQVVGSPLVLGRPTDAFGKADPGAAAALVVQPGQPDCLSSLQVFPLKTMPATPQTLPTAQTPQTLLLHSVLAGGLGGVIGAAAGCIIGVMASNSAAQMNLLVGTLGPTGASIGVLAGLGAFLARGRHLLQVQQAQAEVAGPNELRSTVEGLAEAV